MLARAALLALFLGGVGASSTESPRITIQASSVDTSQPETLRVLPDTLPDGIVGRHYQVHLSTRGGRKPYTWDVRTPSLPEGLTLSQTDGKIAGIPVAAGLYDFTLRVADSSSPVQTATRYFALTVTEPLLLPTSSLPRMVLRFPYRVQLRTTGGTAPLKWAVVNGSLPTGLYLDEITGLLAGAPTQAGEFRFTVRVTDAGEPSQTQTRTFIASVVAPLMVEWERPPQLEAGGIYGSLRAANSTREDFELTVIVLAVNEYGKAFALGYHHFTLEKESASGELLFGFPLPLGEYIVHADAVAEVAPTRAIYRARLQEGIFRVE